MPNLDLSFASGETSLGVSRFVVHEGISTLFTVTVWALSDDPSIDLDSIVGQPAALRARSGAAFAQLGGERNWSGLCNHMALVAAMPGGKSTYEIRIVPAMWLLTQRRGHRIFQHLSIPDIVDQILGEWSIVPTWNVARGEHPKLEFKVQYGESDYDFICRLLEEAGIAFTFPEDAGDPSRLTLDDRIHTSESRSAAPLKFLESEVGIADREVARLVALGHDVRPGAHVIRDYDFRNPAFALLGNAKKEKAPEDKLEQFEYLPGSFVTEIAGRDPSSLGADDKGAYRHDQKYGDRLAQRSLEGERIQKRGVSFETNTIDLWPGVVFSLEGHPHPDLAKGEGLLLTTFFLEGAPGQDWHMAGTAVFTATPYRPPAITPKPRIHSVQSATVVGPAGQEIHTDQFGRVRVQFPWDREGKSDDNSSVWMRVSQGWAGTGYGMITIPRIGQEVLVGFLDGDPDEPVVVGRLFNTTHPVPYKLPDNKTRSDFKTDTSPGSDGFNEILLEDLAGDEFVYQQAQKNLRRLVKHDEIITVVHDREKGVSADETDTTVGNRVEETDKDRVEEDAKDRTTAVKKDSAALVKGDEIERTMGGQVVFVGKDDHLIVKKTKREHDFQDLHLHVKGSHSESAGGYSLSTSSQQEKIGKKDELETGLALHLKAGTVLVAEGASSVTIKGPGGFITIGPGGIDIVGTLVQINEGGSPGSAPDAKPAGPAEPREGDVPVKEMPAAPPPPPPPRIPEPPPVLHWINVVVEDEFGDPIPGVFVKFDFVDGNKQGQTTDAKGKASLNNLPNVKCRITLRSNLFYDDKSGLGTFVPTKDTNVTFGAKDTFSGIAQKHGLEDARTIYYYAKNAALRSKRTTLGAVTVGDTFVVPAAFQFEFPVKPNTTAYEVKLVVPAMLDITTVDDHFAPGVEKLDIRYDIAQLAKQKVTLEITSPNYPDGPIFTMDLSDHARADGRRHIAWDGKANTKKGSLVDRFVHPLIGRFVVKLSASPKHSDEGKFKVLYHSIELGMGFHTPDEKVPATSEKEKYAQYRLNELGYDGGPVNGTLGTVAQKAIKRFQRANYKSGSQTLLAENGTVDADTLAALQVAPTRTRFEAGKPPLTQDAKLYVDDNYFNDRGANFVTTNTPEFNSISRKRWTEDKMERPYVPLEVTIKLLGKANNAVLAPAGVGPAPIAWEADDGAEDATIISSTTNALAFAFVQNARTNGFTGTTAINQTGDNAPKSLEGFRESSAAANIKSWFPDDTDSTLAPYKVKGYGTEARSGTTFHRALVEAYFHATDNPKRVGKAGVYFRHSFKGGDDAKLRVALTFEGLPNKTDLVADHASVAANLFKETGRWTIWRRAKMNAYCQQATPTRISGSPNWATITAWWREAFIEMESGGAPAHTLTYGTVVPEATYKSAILAIPAGFRPPGVTNAASLTYRPSSMYGGPTITQNPHETAQAFITRAEAAMLAWVTNPINAILGVIHDEVRKTESEGLTIFDFRIHDPITGQDWDPTLGAHGGFKPSTNPAVQNQIASTAGYVRLDGAVTMNVDNPFNVNCYVLHECGHARFLYHHKTRGGALASDNPTHHDPAQDRCTMSYGIAPDTPDQWRYPFCGKCILKLRGWKVP